MKNILLIIYILSVQISAAQHLTFGDLLSLHESNTEKCDELLIQKGFIFKSSKTIIDTESKDMTWLYKNSESFESSNEYLIKNCSSVFMNNCNSITYMLSDMDHFNRLKESMKSGMNEFLFSDTSERGVLSHHYLGKGPLEYIFSTFPINSELTVKVFLIEIKKMDVELIEDDKSSTNISPTFIMEAPKIVELGEQFRLTFTIDEGSVQNFKLPELSNFEILMGPSTSQSNIKGKPVQNYIFVLRSKIMGHFNISPASIDFQGTTINSNPATIEGVKGAARKYP